MAGNEQIPQQMATALKLLEAGNIPDGLKMLNEFAHATTDQELAARAYFYIGSTFESVNMLMESDQSFSVIESKYPQQHWARKASRKRLGLFFSNPMLMPPLFPPAIQIEPTNACNLACEMCPRTNMKKGVGMMDFALFQKIIDEAMNHDVMSVKLFFMGEPLLHPQIVEFARYAIQSRHSLVQCGKTSIGIQTNGSWTDASMPEKILSTGIDGLSFSISGIGRENYEKVRKGASYDVLCNNIRETVALRNRMKAPAQITITLNLFQETAEQIKAFKDEWSKVVDQVDLIFTVAHPNRNELDASGNIAPNPAEKPINKNFICIDGLRSLLIRWDGEIGFCCGDYNTDFSLGNAKTSTLSTAWNSPQRKALHRMICQNTLDQIPVCRHCAQRFEIKPETLDILRNQHLKK